MHATLMKALAAFGLIIGSVTAAQWSSSPPSLMTGALILSVNSSCPLGTTEYTAQAGKTLLLTTIAAGNVGETGGADSVTPAGTNAAATFTGTASQVTSAVSGGTPAGSNSAITMSGSTANESAHTHSVTAAGTNGTASFTPAGTVAWPAGVPTAANESAHTHAEALTAAAQTFTGTPSSCVANHVHIETINSSLSGATGNGLPALLDASTSGGPTNMWMSTANNTGGSATCTYAGTNGTSAVSGTSGAGSAHTHTLSWPAGVPTLTGTGGTVPAETFTGSSVTSGAGAAHLHTVGTLAASTPTFTGSALSTHTHTLTPAGTNAAAAFTGTAFDNRSAFVRVIACRVN